jgi:hypothetical protein
MKLDKEENFWNRLWQILKKSRNEAVFASAKDVNNQVEDDVWARLNKD